MPKPLPHIKSAAKRWCLLPIHTTANSSHSYRSQKSKIFSRNNWSTFIYSFSEQEYDLTHYFPFDTGKGELKWHYLCKTLLQIGSNFILFLLEDFVQDCSAFAVLAQQEQPGVLILHGWRGAPVLRDRALVRDTVAATRHRHKRDFSVSKAPGLPEGSKDTSGVKNSVLTTAAD